LHICIKMAEEENKQVEETQESQDELETVEEVVEDKEPIGNTTLENESQTEVNEVDNSDTQEDESSSKDLGDTNTETVKTQKKRDKDNLYEEIEIPEGIGASIDNDILIMKKDDKELRRKLVALIDVKVEGNKIVVSSTRNRRIEKRLFGTFKAHVKNMIKGFEEGFKYKLKIANVHFPMNVSFDSNNNALVVKNFLGEKKDRVIKLVEGVDVKVDKEDIIVTSYDIEKAGHVATKIEKGTKVRNKDRRIFQDGIFLVSKPNKEFM